MSVKISGLPQEEKPSAEELESLKNKRYWKSLEELKDPEGYAKAIKNEFQEELPFGEKDNEYLSATTPRRDFLKYLGFGTAAATLAASCQLKVRKSIPYLNKPAEITPGVPNYYASTYAVDGEYCAVVIKDMDGRPIKIEGNTMSSVTQGGTSARVQGSVLTLYDVTRTRFPMMDGKEASTWQALDQAVISGLTAAGNAPIVLLTSPVLSPSVKQSIQDFIKKYPSAKHIVYEPVSYAAMLMANQVCYGQSSMPTYHFENAKCIVGLDADFLGAWVSPVEFTKQWVTTRKIDPAHPEMSRHFQFESYLSLTGSNADYRYVHKPSETAAIITGLYNAVASALGKPALPNAPAITDQRLAKGIQKATKSLVANKGASLVVCGFNNPNAQVIVNALNEMLGSGGNTIDYSTQLNYHQGIDSEMEQLVNDMNNGSIGALIMYGVNPAYDYYAVDKFTSGLKKVSLTVSLNDHNDETTQLCKYVAPDSHYLESWGDAEPRTGYYSLQQPGIDPLFKTRQALESFLIWSGVANPDALTYVQQYWKTNIFPKYGNGDQWQHWWDQTLQNGIMEPAQVPAKAAGNFKGDVNAAATQLAASAPKPGNVEIVLYESVAIGNGRHSNNPWLQEMPDPMARVTWDNYICVSPAMADKLNASLTRFNEVNYHKPVAKVEVNGKSLNLPIMVLPGMHPEVIAIAVGYGRGGNYLKGEELKKARRNLGVAAASVGKNTYPWVSYNSQTGTFNYTSNIVNIANNGETYLLGITQSHSSYEGRPIVEETTLAAFQKDPEELLKERNEEFAKYGPDFRKDATMYPNEYPYAQGLHWGMAIDMNACIGCGACIIACYAENNVSVVGKEEVAKGHEMQWIRIDRYFEGDQENPQVVFQPMLCQQCDNAPCENVCPVAATSHSDEGLNMMVYNRCIGTRYCENNCPYKVRRFNWHNWTGAGSFKDDLWDNDPVILEMNKSLTRMVLNPDVTVRSRGVMEKCTFCVQRLQMTKLHAKKEGRPIKDGEAVVACQQACPADAIVFGDANDKNSKIYKLRQEQKSRGYGVLEVLHTLPNITYLAKIRNKDEEDFFQYEELTHSL
ncbi:MAG: 4Fe-4S dicluster domain-containing protein [Chitinophagaceae bacterium]|nr:MAG: 4Fe-4S dicluster domain-containing protein [Chitinophagaceae bacterium]